MKKILIVFLIALVFFTVIMVCIFNSVDFLCMIAEGSNEPSSLHNFTIERIYKIAEKKEIGEKLVKNIKENKKNNLHTFYIRILGVIGEEATLPCLMEIYIKHQEETKSIKVYNVIKSLGLLGKEEAVPFLERILNREDRWIVLNPPIAESLYLLTGNQYKFINPQGEMQKLHLYNELLRAREVILNTKLRKRNFKDMVILDKLFR